MPRLAIVEVLRSASTAAISLHELCLQGRQVIRRLIGAWGRCLPAIAGPVTGGSGGGGSGGGSQSRLHERRALPGERHDAGASGGDLIEAPEPVGRLAFDFSEIIPENFIRT